MNRREFFGVAGTLAVGLGLSGAALAAGPGGKLPPAGGAGAKTLDAALHARQSQREYADKPLPESVLSDLLWACCGVNRPDSGKRTAPTAMNRQEVEVFVARKDGLFLYDPKAHALQQKSAEDLRAATGKQAYVGTAPVNLVYVADMARVAGGTQDEKCITAGLDTAFMGQNVYLFCAATGLATVARTGIDVPALAKAMGLAANQRVIMAQCVGYPKA